jgi:hypothetical protein
MTCKPNEAYLELLNGRIDELSYYPCDQLQPEAWSIIQTAEIISFLKIITPEDAENINRRIFTIYPQFEEGLKNRLECAFCREDLERQPGRERWT